MSSNNNDLWLPDIDRDYGNSSNNLNITTKKKKKKKKDKSKSSSSNNNNSYYQTIKSLSKLDENSICADCEQKHLKFVNVSFGTFICRECAKGHMKDLPNLSTIKELSSSTTFTAQDMLVLQKMGNKKANSIYEAILHEKPGRKKPFCSERYIKDKYKYKFFWQQDNKDFNPLNGLNNVAKVEKAVNNEEQPNNNKKEKEVIAEIKEAYEVSQEEEDGPVNIKGNDKDSKFLKELYKKPKEGLNL